MEEQKYKFQFPGDKLRFTLTGAIVFLGIAILLGSCQISNAIKYHANHSSNYQQQLDQLNNNLESIILNQ
ncbi:hypothetical protein [Ammoniphilus resinae]|uniref:Uncharacterized protein n=1 Tax=Ammoniphilus resinae TaxID=861532 RepID=A0ABS4GP45_9BACL|nr:hypothetical protein [Ammoniphilus resinae]MBP1931996.1 hypothetical protein [Ammoniphilus resinae]